MRDVRKEIGSRLQYELDTGWTNAKFLTPNPALEGRVSKHKFNFKLGTTNDASFNEEKATDEQPRRYIEGNRKRKAEDEGYVPCPAGEHQLKKKKKKKKEEEEEEEEEEEKDRTTPETWMSQDSQGSTLLCEILLKVSLSKIWLQG
jgi:hypothetical protein